ncbi:MAG TPA: hypothetical protein VJ878_04795, partial [Candidatus Izemoplasmatales bacterium]|nr:hypothetical protein [Candidatus Izemoplasmatales bacterium]
QISLEGDVGSIGAVRQKIITAYLNQVDMYFVPDINSRNYREALTACLEFGIDPEGWLVPVSTLAEAVSYLEGLEPND